MKKLLLLLTLLLPLFLNAQIVIEHPQCGMSKESYVKIDKIELKDNATIIHFNVKIRAGFKIYIPKTTYIQPEGGEKLEVVHSKGAPLDKWHPMPKRGELSYSLIFPPIDPNCSKLDFSEGIGSGAWFFYDIQLKKSPSIQKVPDEIYGKWHNADDGVLVLCLFDTLAVYKNAIWSYTNIDLEKENGVIGLKSPAKNIELRIYQSDKGLLVGENDNEMNLLTSERYYHSCGAPALTAPILRNDTAFYSGYVYKYNSRCGINTLTVSYNDIITGNQSTYKATINDDGYFSVKIPMLYTHQCIMRTDFFMPTPLYLEPGKELFHVISFDYNRRKTHEFMGELAGVNNELDHIKKIGSPDSGEIREKILDMSSHDYVLYCKEMWNKDVHELDSIYKIGRISEKALQIKNMDLQYEYAVKILSFKRVFEIAYRKANNIDRKQRDLGIEIDSLRLEDLGFINNTFANNEVALVSNNYYYFVNRMKYSDLLREKSINLSPYDAIEMYISDHPKLSFFETKMIQGMQIQDSIRKLPEFVAYSTKYQTQEMAFRRKYNDVFILLNESLNSPPSLEMVKVHLEATGKALTDEENELVAANILLNKNDFMNEMKNIFEGFPKDSIIQFFADFNGYSQQMNKIKRRELREDGFAKIFHIEKGLMTDIMFAQELCQPIVKEMTSMDNKELEMELANLTSPDIAAYIIACNQQTIAANEYRSAHPLSSIHEVPDVEDDKLFEAILKNHAGKVIYVDFWATWCGPCKSGIERIAPLKEEMKDENVAFVYITGESSPLGTWNNMIPGIRGEHYRVNDDQWKYMCQQFGVTGIPHYILVNKNGKIVNSHLPHMQNSEIKKLLKKEL